MADIAEKAQQQQEGQKNFLGMLFSTPFHFLGVMFGSLLGAIVVEWLCMYTFWPDAGWKHAQQMFQHELGWLSRICCTALSSKNRGVRQPGWHKRSMTG